MTTSTKQGGGNGIAVVVCFFLFAMIAFVTNLAAPIGTIWKGSYDWSGMAGNLMNFLAYLFMGIPAGKLLQKYGYKKTALAAMAVGFIGLGFQYLSGLFGAETPLFNVQGQPLMLNFAIYLLGAFICGFCACMLNTVVNPMLNLVGGGGKKGNQLIQIGGSLNSLTGTVTPFLVGLIVGQVTAETSMVSVAPLLWIGMGVFFFSFLLVSFLKIREPQTSGATKKKYSHSPWNFRHYVLGAVGIFFYVGIEVGIPGILLFFLISAGYPEATATSVIAIYWLLMLVGRLVSSGISGVVSSKMQLIVVSCLGMLFVALAILLPTTTMTMMPAYADGGFSMVEVPLAALLLVLCGLCTSVMWGGIFNLAVEGLGKYTAQASGIFMMMVVGGGVMPFIQSLIAGDTHYMASYWLVFAMLAYLFFYAVIGSKNVNKDIPVEEELSPDPRNL